MTEFKKRWQRPELIVLARTRPEEAVLTGCKGTGLVGPGRPAGWHCQHPVQGWCHLITQS